MKTVMCYGDSLTWGYDARDGTRYPFEQRWPGVLQAELGGSIRIIEEALNGRTVATDSRLLPGVTAERCSALCWSPMPRSTWSSSCSGPMSRAQLPPNGRRSGLRVRLPRLGGA